MDLTIPKLGETELKPPPFPEVIEPFDSEWWLDEKHKSVCDAYLGDCELDQVKAFKKIYKPRTKPSAHTGASRFFKKAKVRRYLYFQMRKLSAKVELSQEMILRNLIEVAEMAMGKRDQEMVVGLHEGVVVEHTGKNTDLKAANSALTQLGKYHELGMWVEKKETDVQIVNFNFDMGKPEKVIPHQGEKSD